MVLPATSASCTAFLFAILALCRSPSTLPFPAMSFHPNRYARNHPYHLIGNRRHPAVEMSGLVPEPPRDRIVRNDAEPDFVRDDITDQVSHPKDLHQPLAFDIRIPAGQQLV